MAGEGELDAKLWSELPRELLFLALRRLPISTLCKFRAVCKQWNTLPTIRADDPYLLYIPRFLGLSDLGSCSLYSLSRNKWEFLDLSFAASFTAAHFHAQGPYPMAPYVEKFCSHGGLLCLMGKFVDRHFGGYHYCGLPFSLVCNPLTRTLKVLPIFDCYCIVDLVMHRESSSGVYKIFAAAVIYTGETGFLLHLYMYESDSAFCKWKRIHTLKRDRGEITLLRSCSAVFNDVYYFASGEMSKDIHAPSRDEVQPFELHAYDMKQGSWVLPGVKLMNLGDSNITSVSFVVCNERLLLSATSPGKVTWFYRLDGSEEMKLSDSIAWRTALAYRGSIILASHASLMMVEAKADAKVLKALSVMPVRRCNHPDCKKAYCKTSKAWTLFNVNMAKVSFNVQATL